MSVKIFKKDDSDAMGASAVEFAEWGESGDTNRGIQKLVLPDLSGLAHINADFRPPDNVARTPSELLDEARRQAGDMISVAEERAKEIQSEALDNAMSSFSEKLEEAIAAEIGDLRSQFGDSIERLTTLENDLGKKVERDLVGLALAVSKKIIGKEITLDREIVVDMLNKALSKLRERSLAEVLMNPDDLEYIESHRDKVDFRGTLQLTPDPSISIGGCLIRTSTGDIDARIKSQFEELSHGLLDA